jgi:hypothetical protein
MTVMMSLPAGSSFPLSAFIKGKIHATRRQSPQGWLYVAEVKKDNDATEALAQGGVRRCSTAICCESQRLTLS